MAKNWAIAVGINRYDYLQPLNYAKRDAELIQQFLRTEAGFERIFFFSDDSPEIGGKSTRPTRANLRRVFLELFNQPFMGAGDNFWFFFSGHGMRHAERDYLMPLDGNPADIEETAIPINFVTERLRRCGADNVVLILDACRSLAQKSGEGIGRQTAEEARQQGVISIFSCSPQEYSYEIEALQQGAFTTALLEGLGVRGQCATVERLNQYLNFRVPEIVRQHKSGRQTPYIIAEPVNKSHLILVPRYATLADIATLKIDAYRAQSKRDLTLAKQLWIRVLAAASGQDMEAIEALEEIARLRNSSATPYVSQQPQQPISPKSVTSTPPPNSASSRTNNTPSNPKPITPKNPTPVETPSASPVINLSRRRVIQILWFGSAGLASAIIIPRLWPFGTGENSVSEIPQTTETPVIQPAPQKINLQTFPFQTAKVDAKGNVISRPQLKGKQFIEDLGNGVTLEMVQIPGGTFMMGSPPAEKDRQSDESPQHQVKVPGFFMGKYEITQAQYQAIMRKNPSSFKGEKRPVETVSWDDAVEFCKKLSEKTGRKYRLPSEAEWEYACRAKTETPFYFGETITPELVNYDGNYPYGAAPKGQYRGETTNVGIFPANPFGLFDMCGNRWEWCQDVYNENYQDAPEDGSAWLTGKDNNIKMLRGGSWYSDAQYCRSAIRNYLTREYSTAAMVAALPPTADRHDARAITIFHVGFRVVAVA
ncbi:SUMF1/EgtB/PvdO family nonheme iron enzyme [Nostoc sp. LEGE 06077]|uniref:SUMF1/EgtB/PvdO family nonheme iron enzyme n=1 Tax=Nostoc sp. LEGE 06077 TaxID=915325 RepID=UPI00187F102F|nr:SUMF1/EgtB/PvdO family nonheme iron enzyme [Nostoc sp. LEGE 06077]MBE9207483.1 SUMF1/EgtB/PvdO family nonheme iron enzyme [Nostoc sp. LEGE 06077]